MPKAIAFTNCRLCVNGRLISSNDASRPRLVISTQSGLILHVDKHPQRQDQYPRQPNKNPKDDGNDIECIDLDNKILAPGFIEVQTNGLRGFHFTHYGSEDHHEGNSNSASPSQQNADPRKEYIHKLDTVARYLATQGVTGFYPTIPTVSATRFQQILPCLEPHPVPDGASILGAHFEGPYLHASKAGAHNSSLFQAASTSPDSVYGPLSSSNSHLKIVTLAPDLPSSSFLIASLVSRGIKVSLGHSPASLSCGVSALAAGATMLTHTLNAMAPLHHRDPGLAGLVTHTDVSGSKPPYYSIIPDANHLHPNVAALLFRANPKKCIFTTDSIELSGLPDGTYPGHAQIPHRQTKKGSRVVIEGTETLIGGCAGLAECVRNMVMWTWGGAEPRASDGEENVGNDDDDDDDEEERGKAVAQAIRCVTENVVGFTGDLERGKLESGKRADLVILGDDVKVTATYVAGCLVPSLSE